MPGVIAGAMAPKQQPPAPARPAQPAPQPGAAAPNKAVQRVVMAAQSILYDPKTSGAIMGIVRQSKDPAEGIANAATMLISQLWEASKQSIPPQAIVPALNQIIMLIAEMAHASGVKVSREVVAKAAQLMVRRFEQSAQQGGQPQPGAPAPGAPAAPAPAAPAPAAQPGVPA